MAKSNSADADSSKFENHFNSPVGAWLFTLTPTPNVQEPSPSTPFTSGKVLTVINAGGTVVETELAGFEERANPGMGTWVQTGKYTFEYTLLKAFLNPDGSYSSMEQINQKNVLNQTFDQFSGQSFITRLAQDGNVIFRGTRKIEATRIQVDPNTYPN